MQPTLFADVTNDMTIAREEIFGPVLIVIPFDDDDDAVRMANDNQYGLGGYVTSGSYERAEAVGKQLRAGIDQPQRRRPVRRRRSVRRLQGQRRRSPERRRGLRAVHRGEDLRRRREGVATSGARRLRGRRPDRRAHVRAAPGRRSRGHRLRPPGRGARALRPAGRGGDRLPGRGGRRRRGGPPRPLLRPAAGRRDRSARAASSRRWAPTPCSCPTPPDHRRRSGGSPRPGTATWSTPRSAAAPTTCSPVISP